jgi:hypothetical protein
LQFIALKNGRIAEDWGIAASALTAHRSVNGFSAEYSATASSSRSCAVSSSPNFLEQPSRPRLAVTQRWYALTSSATSAATASYRVATDWQSPAPLGIVADARMIAAASIGMGVLTGSRVRPLGELDLAVALNPDFGTHGNERSSVINPIALIVRITTADMEINRDGPPGVNKFLIGGRVDEA